jgi:hypothetical protein
MKRAHSSQDDRRKEEEQGHENQNEFQSWAAGSTIRTGTTANPVPQLTCYFPSRE